MKNLITFFAIFLMALPLLAQHRHYSKQGGHYSGGRGSSHKGGSYKNTRSNNHYIHHKH
jgi:hypothetical protein